MISGSYRHKENNFQLSNHILVQKFRLPWEGLARDKESKHGNFIVQMIVNYTYNNTVTKQFLREILPGSWIPKLLWCCVVAIFDILCWLKIVTFAQMWQEIKNPVDKVRRNSTFGTLSVSLSFFQFQTETQIIKIQLP